MQVSYAIVEVLKRHSSKEITLDTKPLKQKEILKYIKEDFPHLANIVTEKKLRTALEEVVGYEEKLNEHDKLIHYREDSSGRKTDYYIQNSITDFELAYLIDCVMYGNIFDTSTAQGLAKRIQGLSGKKLKKMTPYASGGFGEQRYIQKANVLENLEQIISAQSKGKKIQFVLNTYIVSNNKTELKGVRDHKVSPHKLLMSNDRYYLLASYDGSEKIYYFRVDLMSQIQILNEKARREDEVPELKNNFIRAEYLLRHPYMMGGKECEFKIRVKKEYMLQIVDTFSYSYRIIPFSETDTTVDIRVKASEKAMHYWLLQYADVAEPLNANPNFKKAMQESVKNLCKVYDIKINE